MGTCRPNVSSPESKRQDQGVSQTRNSIGIIVYAVTGSLSLISRTLSINKLRGLQIIIGVLSLVLFILEFTLFILDT